MSRQQHLESFSDIIQAGDSIRQNMFGDRLTIMENAAEVDAYFYDYSGQLMGKAIGLDTGDSVPLAGFAMVELRSVSTQTVKYFISTGEINISRIAGDVSVRPPTQYAGQVLTIPATGNVTLAVNSDRILVKIQAHEGNSVDIRYTDTADVSGGGLVLLPGERDEVDGTPAIKFFNDDTVAQKVRILEVIQ